MMSSPHLLTATSADLLRLDHPHDPPDRQHPHDRPDRPDRLDAESVTAWARRCREAADPVGEALSSLDDVAPDPGSLAARWGLLAAIGAGDLTVARTVEPHLDARAILHEAGATAPGPQQRWGVYAAEGPGRLVARRGPHGWTLTGTKSWASLAPRLDAALVTARDEDGDARLFALDLRADGVRIEPATWTPRGLELVETPDLVLDEAQADPVGGAGWYVERPGFAAGGIGVAAIWFGAAVALADALLRAAAAREPDQIALLHLGACRVALGDARAQLVRAADLVGRTDAGEEALTLAYEVRASVAAACDEVLDRVGHGLGPAPLVRDVAHARRVADLTVFLRQHHAERDLAALGGRLVQAEGAA